MNRFETTQWSVVLRAEGDSDDARAALATLCRTYRSPVFAYVRSRGYDTDRADDLTQAFFTRFLERGWYCQADPQRGRFRAFLLTALKHFLSDAHSGAAALKRGGDCRIESLDEATAGACAGDADPEREFEKAWVRAVLAAAFTRLREEAMRADKLALFERLSEFLVERPVENDYARAAGELHLQRNTVAVAVHRLRHRLRELVREELGETAAGPEAAEDELRALRESLGAVLT